MKIMSKANAILLALALAYFIICAIGMKVDSDMYKECRARGGVFAQGADYAPLCLDKEVARQSRMR